MGTSNCQEITYLLRNQYMRYLEEPIKYVIQKRGPQTVRYRKSILVVSNKFSNNLTSVSPKIYNGFQ